MSADLAADVGEQLRLGLLQLLDRRRRLFDCVAELVAAEPAAARWRGRPPTSPPPASMAWAIAAPFRRFLGARADEDDLQRRVLEHAVEPSGSTKRMSQQRGVDRDRHAERDYA